MEIIKNGNTKKEYKKYKCKCRICGCKFAFTSDELTVERQKSITNYTDKIIIKCPQCDLSINMDNPYYNNIKPYRWYDKLKSILRLSYKTVIDNLK